MRERCSPAVLRAVEAARDDLDSDGFGDVSPGRLLLALIAEEHGRPALLLEKHGTPPDVIRNRLDPTTGGRISSDRLLAEAHALSRDHESDDEVTSDFFLVALLRAAPTLREFLEDFGLNLPGLEHEALGNQLPLLTLHEPMNLNDMADRMAAARVLDANANRAGEALRVLDDYARFVLDDAFLTGRVKGLRHELMECLDRLPADLLLAARNTRGDVGTSISAPGEMTRDSPRIVAQVNFKRLQEALRSLEEFSKTENPAVAERIEEIRYATYTIEKAIVMGEQTRRQLADAHLFVLLTGSQCAAGLEWTIAEAVAGGANVIQLREKELDDRRLLERAREVRQWVHQAGALFIVNDRPDIARLAQADGVHLGQDDVSVHEARQIVGPDALVGVSTHDIDQVRQAVLDGASYIGIGPIFPSTTKHIEKLAGLEFLKAALAETTLPAFAIGGINLQSVDAVAAAGARRIAVSAAIARADDPRQTAQTLCAALAR